MRPPGSACRDPADLDPAFVAAATFVTLAVLVAVLLPAPFVTWSPGGARHAGHGRNHVGVREKTTEPMISIADIETYPTTGQLDLTIVSGTAADARLTLPEALAAYWLPHRDTLPREVFRRARVPMTWRPKRPR